MSRSKLAALVLALVPALVLAGCSKEEPAVSVNDQVPADQRQPEGGESPGAPADDGEPAGEPDGTWVAENIAFTSAPDSLPAGDVTIELDNQSTLPHDVTFEGVNGDAPIAATQGTDTDTGTVSLDSGTYTYYCSVPGHRDAGMEGEVTVA